MTKTMLLLLAIAVSSLSIIGCKADAGVDKVTIDGISLGIQAPAL